MRLLTSIFTMTFILSWQLCLSQVRDTVKRDIGINFGWRSALLVKEVKRPLDAVGFLQFGVEVRAWRFWLQTGASVVLKSEWNGSESIPSLLVHLSAPYEIPLFKRRLILGTGPILSYMHNFTSGVDYRNDFIGLGLDLELTVPIWKGLSLETCSDFGFAYACRYVNHGEDPRVAIQAVRILSFGINYRFNAY